MKIRVFASGSGGNCLLVSDGGTNILLDAGISMRRIVAFLSQVALTVEDIGGVLITHEHSDHISGLNMLLKHHSVPIFAPRTVAAHLYGLLPDIGERLNIVPVGQDFPLGELKIRAFHTSHDTQESVGYRIEGSAVFALATDTGCVTDEILEGLTGADAVLIESNHDTQMLCDGPYPVYLKRRILSDNGHLSNCDCAVLAKRLADAGTHTVILGHLSRKNNLPALALEASEKALSGSPVELFCAPELGILEIDI